MGGSQWGLKKAVTRVSGSGYGPVVCSTDGSPGGERTGVLLLQMKWAARVFARRVRDMG